MKTKDIKSLLNKETGENTPDVLDNVKISPINKLKKNEKSLVAFKKTMATLILVFLLVIVVVLSIAIHGYTTQDSATIDHFTYLSLRVYDGTDPDGITADSVKAYSFILDEKGKIILAYNESAGERLATPNEFNDIADLIDYKGEATIFLVGTSDNPAFARQFARGVEDCLKNNADFDGVRIIAHVNDSTSKSI
ncbi:MAG: hypothetical protein J6V37_03015, partial [Clostridia bacterium]|nr:hypothetical protein [Clostridia bacterium]